MIDLLGELNYASTANAACRAFSERATHRFPPAFVMPDNWRPELEAMAAELEFPLVTAEEMEQRFLQIIQQLADF